VGNLLSLMHSANRNREPLTPGLFYANSRCAQHMPRFLVLHKRHDAQIFPLPR
jgi:hypothetical protein